MAAGFPSEYILGGARPVFRLHRGSGVSSHTLGRTSWPRSLQLLEECIFQMHMQSVFCGAAKDKSILLLIKPTKLQQMGKTNRKGTCNVDLQLISFIV